MGARVRVTAAGRTDAGPVRAANQDWLEWDLDLGVFLVADGMGGHRAGEVAAHLAIDTVRQFVAQSVDHADLTWPFGFDPHRSVDQNRLATAVRLANQRVYAEGEAHAEFAGMGTTLVAALVTGERVTIASVGDSRAYLWRRGEVTRLTTDDTWIQSVLGEDGDRAALARHPMRHILTSVIGTAEDRTPELVDHVLVSGDRLLLSTDGLHTVLDDAALAGMLAAGDPEELATRLVDEALRRKTTDNATALVVHVA